MTRVRVCALNDLVDKAATCQEVAGQRLAVVRVGDEVYAIGDRCSHADYSLSEGDLYVDELELECPKHGSTFSLTSGEPQCLPATAAVPVFAVDVDGGDVFVEIP